ncbi:MAG: phage holin family protein [Rhodocyclaceae bacterium]|nr:phage holin family protein [Rhodocyclaceae bacterium]
MVDNLNSLLLHWAVTALALWLASRVFPGIRFAGLPSLLASALLLGVVNAFVRPVLILLTLPLTLVTLGFFLLVINALMLKLVAALVRGFQLSGFWTAFFASIFVSILSFMIDFLVARESVPLLPPPGGTWI